MNTYEDWERSASASAEKYIAYLHSLSRRSKPLTKEQIAARDEERRRVNLVLAEEEAEKLDALLGQTGAGEALEMMRDGLWHEVTIVPKRDLDSNSGKAAVGLVLVSDPFDAIEVGGIVEYPKVKIVPKVTTFEVVASSRPREDARLAIAETHSYSYWWTHGAHSSLQYLLRNHGVARALTDYPSPKEPYVDEYSIDREDPRGQFNLELTNRIARRKRSNGLPASIRKNCAAVIDQFPASLRETGLLKGDELRDWVHNMRGSGRIFRAIDRHRSGALVFHGR